MRESSPRLKHAQDAALLECYVSNIPSTSATACSPATADAGPSVGSLDGREVKALAF